MFFFALFAFLIKKAFFASLAFELRAKGAKVKKIN